LRSMSSVQDGGINDVERENARLREELAAAQAQQKQGTGELEQMKGRMVKLTKQLDEEVSKRDQIQAESQRLERSVQEAKLGGSMQPTSKSRGADKGNDNDDREARERNSNVSTKLMRVVDQWMRHKDLQQALLRNASINDMAFSTLVQVLADCPSLNMLDLSQNQITMDSCADIYKPLVKKRPSLIVFFLSIILLVYLALMNLVTAVLVEGALANTQADKELLKQEQYAKLKNALGTLEQLFSEMDADGDGSLTLAEIERVPIDVIPQEFLDNSSVGSMVEVFQILDVDGVGELSQKEFVEGLMNLLMQDVPVETVQTLRLVRSIDGAMKDIAMAVVSNRNACVFRDV